MEKIKSIEQLRMQKELLQLQRMIAELRMKKEIHELKGQAKISNLILPSINGIMKVGLSTSIGKQFLFTTASKLARKIFSKRNRKRKTAL